MRDAGRRSSEYRRRTTVSSHGTRLCHLQGRLAENSSDLDLAEGRTWEDVQESSQPRHAARGLTGHN